jgi:hypothetical protein
MKPIKLLLATFVAAVIVFLWGFLSWAVLPWHEPAQFSNEDAVAGVLKANAPAHAIYGLPRAKTGDETSMNAAMEKFAKGPYLYGVVRTGPSDWSMGRAMALSFARGWAAALLLAMIMAKVGGCFGSRVGLAVTIGLLIGLNSQLPLWIWMESPTNHTVNMVLDCVIEATLMGTVLALFMKSRGAAADTGKPRVGG